MHANDPTYVEYSLDDDEEIIGVYGVKNKTSYFYSLGFIVWKPPKF
jgi:fibronectin type 3 domain-containing protein